MTLWPGQRQVKALAASKIDLLTILPSVTSAKISPHPLIIVLNLTALLLQWLKKTFSFFVLNRDSCRSDGENLGLSFRVSSWSG